MSEIKLEVIDGKLGFDGGPIVYIEKLEPATFAWPLLTFEAFELIYDDETDVLLYIESGFRLPTLRMRAYACYAKRLDSYFRKLADALYDCREIGDIPCQCDVAVLPDLQGKLNF